MLLSLKNAPVSTKKVGAEEGHHAEYLAVLTLEWRMMVRQAGGHCWIVQQDIEANCLRERMNKRRKGREVC